MAGFTVEGPSWHVDDLSGECYPVYVLWDATGKLLLGVAADDGIDDLITSTALGEAERLGISAGDRFEVSFLQMKVGPRPWSVSLGQTIRVRFARAADGHPTIVKIVRVRMPAPTRGKKR